METILYTVYAFFLVIILFFGIVGFIYSKNNKIFYGIIISLFLAFTAYCYKPPISDDLYRHHENIYNIKWLSNSELITYFINSSEKGEVLSKIIVSKIGNVNLLQFGITFTTYSLIFYLIAKMIKGKEYSKFSLLISSLFIITSMSYLTIISNLYFTLAILLFCVGVYKYYEEKNIKITIILLLISFLIHSSMIVCIGIFTMFIISKNKINFKSIFLLAGVVFSINLFVPWLYQNFNNNFTSNMYNYYISYILDTYNISRLHSNFLMFVYYLKMLPFALLCFSKNIKSTDLENYTKYNLIFILIMSFLTSFSIRYIPIIQIFGYSKIIEFLNINDVKNKKNRIAYVLILLIVIMINIMYQYRQIMSILSR